MACSGTALPYIYLYEAVPSATTRGVHRILMRKQLGTLDFEKQTHRIILRWVLKIQFVRFGDTSNWLGIESHGGLPLVTGGVSPWVVTRVTVSYLPAETRKYFKPYL
jgi:hypothetical protein